MHRTVTLSLLVLSGLALALLPSRAPGQNAVDSQRAYLRVFLPADADLVVDGTKTKQTGAVRRFVSPPLAGGKRYLYTLRATWKQDGQEKTEQRTVRVEAGQETTVDFRPPGTEQQAADTGGQRRPDVVFVPTPQEVVDKMLELAKVKKGDVVYDLGCGDGRIVVTAAKKYGCKAFGFDIDPERIKESLANVQKNHVEDLVTIKQADIFTLDLRPASVVTLYLLPELNVKLMPQLEKLKPGSRIVSHDFDMRGAKPNQVVHLTPPGSYREHTIYLWIVPWEKE